MRDITLCHPRLQLLAAELVEECARQGLKIKITETLRTMAEQDALYAQGRTKPGSIITNAKGSTYSSMHQWGVAFDFCRNDGQGAFNESGRFFEAVGAIGQRLGLEWGGAWTSIVDRPHFQLPDWGSTTGKLRGQYANPDVFIKTWVPVIIETVGWIQDGNGWWYRHADGSFTSNDWEQIDGKWYWFDGAGYAVHNAWSQGKDGRWYYMGEDCSMVTSAVLQIRNEVFAFGADGAMITDSGKLKISGRGAISLISRTL